MNLLEETLDVLKHYDLTWDDVLWVGCKDFMIPLDDFARLANKFYDDGFGAQEVARNLNIVGVDWWLERHEYDGSEWWEFKTMPTIPQKVKVPFSLFESDYIDLKNIFALESNDAPLFDWRR